MDLPSFGSPRGAADKTKRRNGIMSLASFDTIQRLADRIGSLFILGLGLMVGGATALVGF
jgi:hypothetical protein